MVVWWLETKISKYGHKLWFKRTQNGMFKIGSVEADQIIEIYPNIEIVERE